MPSADAVAAGLIAASLPVEPPGLGVCRFCCTGVDPRYDECRNCYEIGLQLGAGPVPVTPMALATRDSQLYLTLKQYKSGRAVARTQSTRLAAFMAVFLRRHLPCVAPTGIDAAVVVPSSTGRTSPHPLTGVLERVSVLPPVQDLLASGTAHVERGQASRDLFMGHIDAAGRRVLLVDDTYTTGTRMQSAAWALGAAGAASVHPVVVGRFLRDDWEPSHVLLTSLASRNWDPGRCIHCAP